MNSKFKLSLVSLASVALLGVGLSQTVNAQDDQIAGGEEVEVVFWHAMNDAHQDWLVEATEEFNSLHDNVTVVLENQGNYGALSQSLLASVRSNTAPTISQAYGEWMLDYEANDQLVDLTDFIENGFDEEEPYEDIFEVFREDNTFGDAVYGLPFNKSTRVLFVNNDLLEEVGVETPETWDDLLSVSEAVYEEAGVIGFGFENGLQHEFPMWVKQAGGEFVDEENNEVLFNSEEGLKALTFINDLINSDFGRIAGEDEYLSGPFTTGDVAMYIGSSAGIPFVENYAGDMNWTTAPVPTDVEAAAPFQGTNITMFASATEGEQEAAFEYMKFLVNGENTVSWAQTTGYLPVRESALESEEWTSYVEENEVFAAPASQFDIGFIEERVPGAFAMKNAMQTSLESMIYEGLDPETTLEEMSQAAQDEIDRAQ